ncbi:beta strand repeat-containing protein [Bdellovibrio sp.]|uniref:beta strand repeat-containing protein n=1 Tax=Bdellovibrio sp. TaxID=28201 RepID=UPI0039E27AA7
MYGLRHLWSVLLVFTLGCGNITAGLDLYSRIALGPNKNLPSDSIIVNDTRTLTPSGGKGPYSYEVISGGGSIDKSGSFTAPATAGDVTIRIRDSLGLTYDYILHVKDTLNLNATHATISVANTTQLSPQGGIEPYEFSLISGDGHVNSSGMFTPSNSGTTVIQVRDAAGNISQTSITTTPALTVTPAASTLWTKQNITLNGVNGVPPYSYALVLGGGSVLTTTGAYTAPALATLSHIEVTDSLGNTALAAVTVNQGVSISSASVTLASGNSFTFSASSGPPPYVYSITSGSGLGAIDSSTGQLTTTASGTITVRVTDAASNTSDSEVTVNPSLQITPSSKTLAVNNTFTFSNTGGVGPFTFDILSGGGSVDSSSGLFTAPGNSGTTVVRITDSLNNQSSATVTINPALAISTTTPSMTTENTAVFVASGGVAPYVYSVSSGGGGVNSSTGLYTPPGTPGNATILVTDSLGNTATDTITILDALTFSANHSTIAANNTVTLSTTGGVSPLNFSIDSGPGAIDSGTQVYTPGSNGNAILRVTDQLGNTRTVNVTVNAALTLSPSTTTTAINKNQDVTASGGVPPYSYNLISGGGSFSGTTYTAPSTATTSVVQVTDSLGNVGTSTITVLDWIEYTISANTNNFNMYTAMGSPTLGVNYRVIINAGVTISSSSTATPAFTTGSGWPGGSQLEIINNGSIIGRGGNGGSGSSWTGAGYPGGNGGPALQATTATTVINNGTVAGGGGGGGGAGVSSSSGGSGVNCDFYPSAAGGSGTLTPGSGGAPGADGSGLRSGGAGGIGGALGQAGSPGGSAFNTAGDAWGITAGGAGGAAGSSALGNSYLTWSPVGTRLGPLTP